MTEWMTACHILFSEYPLCFMNLFSYVDFLLLLFMGL